MRVAITNDTYSEIQVMLITLLPLRGPVSLSDFTGTTRVKFSTIAEERNRNRIHKAYRAIFVPLFLLPIRDGLKQINLVLTPKCS